MVESIRRKLDVEKVPRLSETPRRRLLDKATFEILEIMEKAGKPVSIDYVRYHAKISWEKARALLFYLTATGLVEAVETTRGHVFRLVKKK